MSDEQGKATCMVAGGLVLVIALAILIIISLVKAWL